MAARILVVDDDPHILDLIRDTLEPEGYEIVATQDPLAALDSAEAGGFALLITDYQMEPLRGDVLTGLARLREQKGELSLREGFPPIIIVSAYAGTDRVRKWKDQEGVHAILPKPFTPRELRAAVKSVLEKPQ